MSLYCLFRDYFFFNLLYLHDIIDCISVVQLVHTMQTARLGKFAHGVMAMVFFTAVSGMLFASVNYGICHYYPKISASY